MVSYFDDLFHYQGSLQSWNEYIAIDKAMVADKGRSFMK